MKTNRLLFLKDAFTGFELKFADDYSSAAIVNPNYNENITVYDEEYEFIACFSFQHRHFEDEDEIIEWIRKIISGNKFAIEFFCKGQQRFGSEIESEKLPNLSYEQLKQFTGYYGLSELLSIADTFKVRGWNNQHNFDATLVRDDNGHVLIKKVAVTDI